MTKFRNLKYSITFLSTFTLWYVGWLVIADITLQNYIYIRRKRNICDTKTYSCFQILKHSPLILKYALL